MGFTAQLSVYYLQGYPNPIVDKTGYEDYVDLELDADLTDVDSINEALKKYDLKLVEREEEIEILVISDTQSADSN